MLNSSFTKIILVTFCCGSTLYALIEPFDMHSTLPETIEHLVELKASIDPDRMLYDATRDKDSNDSSSSRDDHQSCSIDRD